MVENPVFELLRGSLSAFDFAVMEHGIAPHGRDYVFVIQDVGTRELTFTHVVDLKYETRVRDDLWLRSWTDEFIDYSAWQAAGEPQGNVFGTNWSLAYPGISLPDACPEAESWSSHLGREMHAVAVETDRFSIRLIFNDVSLRKVSDDTSTIRQAVIPLPRKP